MLLSKSKYYVYKFKKQPDLISASIIASSLLSAGFAASGLLFARFADTLDVADLATSASALS